MIKNFIFDFDGTLADSSLGIYQAFKICCIELKLKVPIFSEFKTEIGPPISQILNIYFPDLDKNLKVKFVNNFREKYDNYYFKNITWYEKVFETLDYLKKEKDAKLFIISNKPTLPCINLLKELNKLSLFEKVIGIDYKIFNKEKNAFIFENKAKAFDYFFLNNNYKKDQSIYIGDTFHDKYAAESCDLNFIAVRYGFYNWDQYSDEIGLSINSFNQIINLSL